MASTEMLNFLCSTCRLFLDANSLLMRYMRKSIGQCYNLSPIGARQISRNVGDNFTKRSQLDSIRMRKSRFICINDNMINPSKEVKQALSDFFEALWPHPSPFELPEGQSNHLLRYDAILAERTRKQEQGFIASLQHDLSTLMTRIIATCGATLEVYISYAIKLILSYVLAASESFSEHLRALGAEESALRY